MVKGGGLTLLRVKTKMGGKKEGFSSRGGRDPKIKERASKRSAE